MVKGGKTLICHWTDLIFAPLLIWQGRQVRQRTPRLFEAQGERAGTAGRGRPAICLLVLGDSAAAGVGVARQQDCLAAQIAGLLGENQTVRWQLEARSGLSTVGMIQHLDGRPQKKFDVVVTSLGVNDVKAGVPPAVWLARQKDLVWLIRKKFSPAHLVLSQVPPMDKFPALPWPLNRYLGRQAALMNQVLAAWAKTEPDLVFLSLDLPVSPQFMAEDGFHPGPVLHRVWAQAVVACLRSRGITG